MTNTKTRKRKPAVAIVGAGRLGQALALSLQSAGYPVVALVARRRQKAEKAVELLTKARPGLTEARPKTVALTMNELDRPVVSGSRPTLRTSAEQNVLRRKVNSGDTFPFADLIIIATPDDAIAETAERLATGLTGETRHRTAQLVAPRATSPRGTIPRGTVLHTSGALSSDVLGPLAQIGFHTGSLHPLVSVSEPRAGARGLHGAFYCLEGDATAVRIARAIVKDLQGSSFSIRPESKALYHAAALMAAGHITALFDLSTELLAACGLKKSQAREVLLPLVESAVGNLQVSTPEKALTGTFARGDVATVRRHLAALSGKKHAEALAVYKLLGLRSLQLAASNNLDPRRVNEITKLLKQ